MKMQDIRDHCNLSRIPIWCSMVDWKDIRKPNPCEGCPHWKTKNKDKDVTQEKA